MSAEGDSSDGISQSEDRPVNRLYEFFEYYRSEFIPAYADVLAFLNKKPDETLYEIEQMLSHIDKVFDPTLDEKLRIANVDKAIGHLERAILDCVKIIWIEINNKIDLIYNDTPRRRYCVNMSESEFTKKYLEYNELLSAARRTELESVGISPSKSIPEYKKAILLGKELLESIDSDKLNNFSFFSRILSLKSHAISFALGCAASLFATYLYARF